jgi:hypothetical protein
MIKFDKNGNPQPPGITNIPIADFKLVFVDSFGNSKTRTIIFEKYESYISDFKNIIHQEFNHWVNGSYTTKKKDPNDIDIVKMVEFNEDVNSKQSELRSFLTVGGSKEKYLVDGYFIPIYAKDDPRYVITEQGLNHWAQFFGHDRENRAKTLFELSYN